MASMQGRFTTAMMQASTWTTTTATFYQGATTLAATMTKRANILWNNQIVLKYINILVNEWTSDKQWWKELKKREEWGMREDADQWGMKWQKKRGSEWRRIPPNCFSANCQPSYIVWTQSWWGGSDYQSHSHLSSEPVFSFQHTQPSWRQTHIFTSQTKSPCCCDGV